MLELAALGLLQQESLHGYRLKQRLELFMSGCISANYGAIYPLLRRLEQKGFVRVSLLEEGTRGLGRKVYQITEEGKQRWKHEMMDFPQESWIHSRSRFMIKFFFFSDLMPEERLKLLEQRLMVCRLRLEDKAMQELPKDAYQDSVWQRCQEMTKNDIYWLEKQIVQEKANLLVNVS